ncbi:MAG TPA: YciI-like protein [Kofleriaceae bacterium]|nr:YciI-like protein [Kofleriaceae bacterium]
MYFALIYDTASDYLERRSAYRADHLALARSASERGELVLAGAFADPADQALLVFEGADRSVAERFAAADPYVQNGLVKSWRVRPWTVVIGRDFNGS